MSGRELITLETGSSIRDLEDDKGWFGDDANDVCVVGAVLTARVWLCLVDDGNSCAYSAKFRHLRGYLIEDLVF